MDRDAEKEIRKLEKKDLIDKDYYHLLEKNFEDYYSKDVLMEVVSELAKKGETKEKTVQKKLELKEPVVEKIDAFLGRKNWKVEVGLKVIAKMTPEQIQEEMNDIIRFLRKVARELPRL